MIQDTSAQDVLLTKPKISALEIKIVVTLVFALLFAAMAYPLLQRWSSADLSIDASRVRMAWVKRGEFVRDISVQGNIIAANSPKLYAPAMGTVTLMANPGDVVVKGQLIAEVSSPELENRLQQEQATLESLTIALERQKIASKQTQIKSHQQIQLEEVILNAANRELRRAEKSIKVNAISQIDYEKVLDDVKRSKLKYEFAKEQADLEKENLAFELRTRQSEVNQYQLKIDKTKRLVDEMKILAPVSGIVGSWSVEQKSAVAVNQALLTVVDLSEFQVEIEIPESYADSLGIGMGVVVNYNNNDYQASIVSISPEVKNNTVKGRVAFVSEPPPGIKQNQRVSSRVILEQKNNVLYLPRGAFVQSNGGRTIFVVNGNQAMLTDINIGQSSIDKIEILSGIKEGQQVIISNTDFVNKAKLLVLN